MHGQQLVLLVSCESSFYEQSLFGKILTSYRLSAIFGIPSDAQTWAAYQSGLSSFWGSTAYLFSSLLQWYEAVNKGDVLAFPNANVLHETLYDDDNIGVGDEVDGNHAV